MTAPAPEGGTPAGQQPAPTPPAGDPTPPAGDQGQQQEPRPTETVEFWKQKAREQETRAKANATAAQELDKIKQGQMTEQEKTNAAATAAQKERDEARAETARWKAAAAHGIGEAHFDLLGTGTEDEIGDRAKRLGVLLASHAELTEIKKAAAAQQGGQPAPLGQQPVPGLQPGAPKAQDNSYPESWFPQRVSGNRT